MSIKSKILSGIQDEQNYLKNQLVHCEVLKMQGYNREKKEVWDCAMFPWGALHYFSV